MAASLLFLPFSFLFSLLFYLAFTFSFPLSFSFSTFLSSFVSLSLSPFLLHFSFFIFLSLIFPLFLLIFFSQSQAKILIVSGSNGRIWLIEVYFDFSVWQLVLKNVFKIFDLSFFSEKMSNNQKFDFLLHVIYKPALTSHQPSKPIFT